MPGVTNPARHAGQPELERHAERVRKDDAGVKFRLVPNQIDRIPKGVSA